MTNLYSSNANIAAFAEALRCQTFITESQPFLSRAWTERLGLALNPDSLLELLKFLQSDRLILVRHLATLNLTARITPTPPLTAQLTYSPGASGSFGLWHDGPGEQSDLGLFARNLVDMAKEGNISHAECVQLIRQVFPNAALQLDEFRPLFIDQQSNFNDQFEQYWQGIQRGRAYVHDVHDEETYDPCSILLEDYGQNLHHLLEKARLVFDHPIDLLVEEAKVNELARPSANGIHYIGGKFESEESWEGDWTTFMADFDNDLTIDILNAQLNLVVPGWIRYIPEA
jgi:hypothetical protein